jgi:hypothetical protein
MINMLCMEEVAKVGQLGSTTTDLCAQGVVLACDLNNAVSELDRATRASDLAYLYMSDKRDAKQFAAEIAHRVYEEAASEWAEHMVLCRVCRQR